MPHSDQGAGLSFKGLKLLNIIATFELQVSRERDDDLDRTVDSREVDNRLPFGSQRDKTENKWVAVGVRDVAFY